ncbi:unnamed protein product [Orchesella dallaii]|uniref:MICOS complex subunit MIC19 n=1 Tax=Orchesella dallaii TaxID=48710 RepID=A0ABP1PYF7_9HEXA
MGAGPSRSVSFRNPEPQAKIIQITEEVAQRMTQRHGKPAEPAAEQKPATPAKPVEQRPPTVSDIVNPNPPPAAVAQTAPPSGLLTVGARGVPIIETITAYEVRQQKEQEIRDNDEFWGSKLKELEARYVASAFVADAEFTKEVEKLDKLVPKPREPVCQDVSAKVAKCYSEHTKQPLKCSDVVKEFAVCVENHTVKGPVSLGA